MLIRKIRYFTLKKHSSLSKASSYEDIGQFWIKHDLSKHWDQTEPVKFTVNIQSERTYYSLDKDLSIKINKIALQQGISAETLVNLWVKDKVNEQTAG